MFKNGLKNMNVRFNDPDVTVDIACVWCHEKFELPKKEAWFHPYICPSCGKPMGIPTIEKGTHYDDGAGNRVAIPVAHCTGYEFTVVVTKGRVMPFLQRLLDSSIPRNACTGIERRGDARDTKATWLIHVKIKDAAFEMDGVTWTIPGHAVAT